ncbi:hypothetical protein HPB47_012690 [Ixodes persulcatus]|uniref:Uncharacterized protein n=1 Tax=Ixodes persulcatus TaxID=34615 RepID=A0AC60NSZ8_IXOPE|nr:hypothetical protein HPB47_012690 [Ixodes persulcatus]
MTWDGPQFQPHWGSSRSHVTSCDEDALLCAYADATSTLTRHDRRARTDDRITNGAGRACPLARRWATEKTTLFLPKTSPQVDPPGVAQFGVSIAASASCSVSQRA